MVKWLFVHRQSYTTCYRWIHHKHAGTEGTARQSETWYINILVGYCVGLL